MEAYYALAEEMTKQQCIQNDLDDGNFTKYAVHHRYSATNRSKNELLICRPLISSIRDSF